MVGGQDKIYLESNVPERSTLGLVNDHLRAACSGSGSTTRPPEDPRHHSEKDRPIAVLSKFPG